MKTFLLFSVLSAILVAGVRCEWEKTEEECVQELNLDKKEMQKLDALEIVPEDNADYQKMIECEWKKEGSMKADGELDWDKIVEILIDEFKKEFGDNPSVIEVLTGTVVLGIVDECKEENIKGANPGQTAVKVQNCVFHKVKKFVQESNESKLHLNKQLN